jgi:hypothetical protein
MKRVIGLLNHATFDQIAFRQAMVDLFYELAVLLGVGGVKIVKLDHEPAEITLVFLLIRHHHFLGADALFPGLQHDGGAMSIAAADENAVATPKSLEANPDIRLNVFNEVPQVDGPVRVRQSAGDQDFIRVLVHRITAPGETSGGILHDGQSDLSGHPDAPQG